MATYGNVTISDNDDDANNNQNESESSGGAINGGHFGGENYGIKGGVFHGNVYINGEKQ
ncbi:hypothetical protein [Streptomyces sp. NPDC002215]|uniref:hypothetical protein n=1 Tax=Streptomyces sp. NPDC002215 TaxID=3154412 RepID=UPI00331A229C